MSLEMCNCTIKSFALVTNKILSFLRNQVNHRRRHRRRRNHNRPHPHHRHLARILFDLIHLHPLVLPVPSRLHRI